MSTLSILIGIHSFSLKLETFQVEQTYLTQPPGTQGYTYVRRRGQQGTYTYTHSMVRQSAGSDELVILERAISGREYVALLKQMDSNRYANINFLIFKALARLSVKKKIQCFLYNNTYYELQTYIEPNIGLSVVKTEVAPEVKTLSFPSFLQFEGKSFLVS
jgi:hypothetical protein